MCNEINRLEERTVSAKVQRKFLLKKLFQLEKPEQRGNGEKNQRRTNLVQGLSNSKTSSIQNEPTTAKTENDENKIDNASQVLQVT
uniref:Uncharacterized protein n=2 Tax=Ciona intestinalis TaxID=7719 RepID=H2XR75_CIOIN